MLFLLMGRMAWCQTEHEDTMSTSCSLFIKTTVFTPDSFNNTGIAKVEATLTDKTGTPISGQTINLTSTSGNFTCIPPISSNESVPDSTQGACLVTGPAGTMKAYLVNIPFNKRGKVKATCTYGNFQLKAGGSYIITRKKIRKK
jgi:hypothetical protein